MPPQEPTVPPVPGDNPVPPAPDVPGSAPDEGGEGTEPQQ